MFDILCEVERENGAAVQTGEDSCYWIRIGFYSCADIMIGRPAK